MFVSHFLVSGRHFYVVVRLRNCKHVECYIQYNMICSLRSELDENCNNNTKTCYAQRCICWRKDIPQHPPRIYSRTFKINKLYLRRWMMTEHPMRSTTVDDVHSIIADHYSWVHLPNYYVTRGLTFVNSGIYKQRLICIAHTLSHNVIIFCLHISVLRLTFFSC